MRKAEFIQCVLVRSLPSLDKVEAGIGYAETLWEALTHHGYGSSKEAKPQKSKDWYKTLSTYQREYFNRFWSAFALKQGRDGAAMRWHQLGEPSQAEYERIIAAAEAESRRPLGQGQVRKMAQGWLQERRYDDYQMVKGNSKTKISSAARERSALEGELAGLQRLYAHGKDKGIGDQIKRLEAALLDHS